MSLLGGAGTMCVPKAALLLTGLSLCSSCAGPSESPRPHQGKAAASDFQFADPPSGATGNHCENNAETTPESPAEATELSAGGMEGSGKVGEPCRLTQQDIFGTLSKSLGKMNRCIQDEKQRNERCLPPTLTLKFSVMSDGHVADFQILQRDFRTGAMNDCMRIAFAAVRFPESAGSICPVTIPVKIGQ